MNNIEEALDEYERCHSYAVQSSSRGDKIITYSNGIVGSIRYQKDLIKGPTDIYSRGYGITRVSEVPLTIDGEQRQVTQVILQPIKQLEIQSY